MIPSSRMREASGINLIVSFLMKKLSEVLPGEETEVS